MAQPSGELSYGSWGDHETGLGYVPAAGARVLVVEDEHLVALDIQLRLTRMGYVPVVAFTGAEALARAADEPFDLVLMDIRLKGAMDGIEAATAIRAAHDVPVIYLTAYADNPTVERARLTEPYGYLLKPFQDRELKATIQIALQRHASERFRQEQQQIQRFLSEASALMASTLDYRSVVLAVADLLIPRYADWCRIDLRESEGYIPAFTYTRPEGAGPEAPDDARVSVPLAARDIMLGTLTLVTLPGRARHAGHDRAFAEDLAHRLAMALDNALLYQRAERAIRIRDDVLAIVSHDLRSPLATILLRAQAIQRHPDLDHIAQAIMRSARRMNRLIGDLLDASAINAGKLTLDVRDHDVRELVHEACEMFRAQAEQSSIKLLEEVSPEQSSRVHCDRDRVLQVFSNVISYALKFTPENGTVRVAATCTDKVMRGEVSDTGCGIPAEQLPHLFDRFWQAQGRRDTAGLGLYITRGILVAHGADLAVESTVGNGSTFWFALPLSG
jgi:signal transduction histidine kinase